jgi:hypothetical protein
MLEPVHSGDLDADPSAGRLKRSESPELQSVGGERVSVEYRSGVGEGGIEERGARDEERGARSEGRGTRGLELGSWSLELGFRLQSSRRSERAGRGQMS